MTKCYSQTSDKRHLVFLAALTVAVICLIVFLPALSCDFVNFDDPEYVLDNLAIRNLDWNLISAAFTQTIAGFWMPLTLISFAIDYTFWGLNPLGYHLTNILLHSLNAALVVFITDSLLKDRYKGEGWQGKTYIFALCLAGLFFGIHPLRVESVAWITERKDDLNGAFTLGAALLYIRYTARKKSGMAGARTLYLLSIVFFAASLMAKSVSVVLPLQLLILDWFPLKRFQNDRLSTLFVEKLPFFILSAAMSLITILVASQEAFLISYDAFPFLSRLIVSGNAIYEYCALLLVPFGIIPVYKLDFPIPDIFMVTTVIIFAVTCFCVLNAQRPGLVTTWLLFIIPLAPTLAFFQNSTLSHAARFTYLPSVALSIAVSFLFSSSYSKISAHFRFVRMRSIFIIAVSALFISYGYISIQCIEDWKTSETMWTKVISHQHFSKAYWFRGISRQQAGSYDAAVKDFTDAISVISKEDEPDIFNLYAYRGFCHLKAKEYKNAIQDFSYAISMYKHPSYYLDRGTAYEALGDYFHAHLDYETAGEASTGLNWYSIAN